MDALLILNTDAQCFTSPTALEALAPLVERARTTGGVLVIASAGGQAPDGEVSVFGANEAELVLSSTLPDLFDGVDELAIGLHDLAIDRVVVAGTDLAEPGVTGACEQTAMAALACNFDVIVVADATIDAAGQPVSWLPGAEVAGAMVKPAADIWLRM